MIKQKCINQYPDTQYGEDLFITKLYILSWFHNVGIKSYLVTKLSHRTWLESPFYVPDIVTKKRNHKKATSSENFIKSRFVRCNSAALSSLIEPITPFHEYNFKV